VPQPSTDSEPGLSADEPSQGNVRALLSGRGGAVAALAATSTLAGLAEALFLVVVARSAFAITDGDDQFGLVAGIEVTTEQAVGIALALVVVRTVLAVVTSSQSAKVSNEVVADIRRELARSFMAASWSEQHGNRTGRLQDLLTTFANQGAILIGALLMIITAGASLAALLASAIAIDPVASIVVIGAIAVLGMVLRPLRKAVKGEAKRVAATGMEFATSLNETSQLGMELHVFHVQPQATERIDGLIDRNEKANRRLAFLRQIVPVIYTGMAYLAIVLALGVVAAIDTASLTSVGAVMLVMLRSLGYGQNLQTAIATFNSSLPFLGTLDDELARYRRAALVDHGQPIGRVGALRLQDVSFEYTTDTPVLRHVSATIEPHEIVGIVGPSGSGKSTLVQLLLGLRSPTSGLVLADERDISVLSRAEWARKITFVPQQAHLIAGTVAANIRFLRDDVSQEQIEEAARLANLHHEVLAMAGGYDRQVGEQGSHLSGGQQQRLIIARALVENPDVLILDEPTSSLDVRSESLIRATLDSLRERMTVIVIAHRLSTLDICDRLMVVQDGELKAFDTPENLEKDNDFYREALALSGLR
jgi:ATP-binding cassette, subfamily B, bacterial